MWGHPLTIAGLACTAFPKRASSRGHVVKATAKLGAPALTGLILLSLGLVGLGGLWRKPRVGTLGTGLPLGGDSRLPGGGGQEEGGAELGAYDAELQGKARRTPVHVHTPTPA